MSVADDYVDDLFDLEWDGPPKNKKPRVNHLTQSYYIAVDKPLLTFKQALETQTTQEVKMEKLYKVNGKNRYGVFMAENSRGEAILEMKDTGQYEAFSYSAISKVMPYTFDVMFNGVGQVYSYKGTPGSIEKGDLLLTRGSNGITVVVVVGVDTKSEKATKVFDGYKLNATRLS